MTTITHEHLELAALAAGMTARWWRAYGIPRAVAAEPTHWMPIPDAPEAAR